MFGRRCREEDSSMHDRDGRLSGVLRQWRDIEPSANFETAVWGRLQTNPVHEQRGRSSIGWLRDRMLPQPAWAGALAAVVAIAVGVLTGIPMPSIHEKRFSDAPLLDRQTLAGSYLHLVTGHTP